ncbi:tumor protein D54-like isoform X3 [Ornithodoros turicata]|uniref:tumor protein D54-like isoform X3 n=1 Tax=Ornithodoros turicata TaxID=34597 RepID=UPI003139F302
MDRVGLAYEEDPYLPERKAGDEEPTAYDGDQDLGKVGATDPTLDDEGRTLLRLAAGEEIEELPHDSFFDAPSEVKGSDATPDSGVHDLSHLDPEEKARLEEAWRNELAEVEGEILSLRTVLSKKVARAQELKQKLGITVWKELKSDMEQGLKNIQDSTASLTYLFGSITPVVLPSYQNFPGLFNSPAYQKTTTSIKVAGEKTTSALGNLGASMSKKLGEMKNSPAFKSVEEKVGSVYTNVKVLGINAVNTVLVQVRHLNASEYVPLRLSRRRE